MRRRMGPRCTARCRRRSMAAAFLSTGPRAVNDWPGRESRLTLALWRAAEGLDDIGRWDPDAMVGLTASLVDPATGRVVWSTERPTSPVPTPGEVALGPAYVTAARKVMEELLAPLGPERPPAA